MRGKLIVFEGGEGSGKTTQLQRLYVWLNENEGLNLLRAEDGFAGVKLTREPGGTDLGKHIRRLLLSGDGAAGDGAAGDGSAGDGAAVGGGAALSSPKAQIADKTELLLYAADRAQHVEETLIPWLAQGYWVLCDRYTDSTVAYQGYGRQLDLGLINQLNQIATGGLKSDLTLWLKVPPAVGLARMRQRGQADRIEQASEQFHQRVSDGFAALAKASVPLPNDLKIDLAGDLAGNLAGNLPGNLPGNLHSSGPTAEIDGDRPEEVVAAHIQQIIQQRLAQWYPHLL